MTDIEMVVLSDSHYLVPCLVRLRCSLLRGHTSSVCCLLVNWELRLRALWAGLGYAANNGAMDGNTQIMNMAIYGSVSKPIVPP